MSKENANILNLGVNQDGDYISTANNYFVGIFKDDVLVRSSSGGTITNSDKGLWEFSVPHGSYSIAAKFDDSTITTSDIMPKLDNIWIGSEDISDHVDNILVHHSESEIKSIIDGNVESADTDGLNSTPTNLLNYLNAINSKLKEIPTSTVLEALNQSSSISAVSTIVGDGEFSNAKSNVSNKETLTGIIDDLCSMVTTMDAGIRSGLIGVAQNTIASNVDEVIVNTEGGVESILIAACNLYLFSTMSISFMGKVTGGGTGLVRVYIDDDLVTSVPLTATTYTDSKLEFSISSYTGNHKIELKLMDPVLLSTPGLYVKYTNIIVSE